MLISSSRVIWPISWATRCETGARDVTHGQVALAAGEAWLLVAAIAAVADPPSRAAIAVAIAPTRRHRARARRPRDGIRPRDDDIWCPDKIRQA
jgi:hypothetical protein